MEHVLRCNDLKCRLQLHDQAVVTTCSHVFCIQCADATALSRSASARRTCPACNTLLPNPDDVVVAGLNPLEDYKTSVLSGLSPTVIMECASRGLAFYSYQTSQEILYQEHLAKGLTDKFNMLNQQMDQLMHDANSQIKLLQEKLQAMQMEQTSVEAKNDELVQAYKDKNKAHQQLVKLYQALKGQVMATHIVDAASHEAHNPSRTIRDDKFVSKIPGAKIGSANPGHGSVGRQAVSMGSHRRMYSESSESSGVQQGGVGLSAEHVPQAQGSVGRRHIDRCVQHSTPSQAHHSRLPVLGGSRQDSTLRSEARHSYRDSAAIRIPLGSGFTVRNLGNSALGARR